MPAGDSPALIVARYLKANNYNQTYEAFISEVGLEYDAGNVSKGDLTLETLLEEKKTFDISVHFEKLGVDDGKLHTEWQSPAPCNATVVRSLPSTSNILSTRLEELAVDDDWVLPVLLASSADKRLHLLDAGKHTLIASLLELHDSPVLSCTALGKNHILTCSMSGQLHVSDLKGNVVEKRRDHLKYVVRVAVFQEGEDTVVATAGWDNNILIYRPQGVKLGDPKASIPLPTKPEAIAFVRHPDNGEPVLLVGRTDSSFIFYYTVEDDPRLLGKQNLAPHSNAWVAFTPSSLEVCPTDPALVAVGTSTVPSMKLLIVKLLFPPWEPKDAAPAPQSLRVSLLDDGPATETQASQARAALAIADREHAAIQIHCTTHAPQTAYSTPAVAWRPDGSGVWVNGDDGAIRGIEASTGKVVSTLQGHEAGSKVRCLCAGMVGGQDGGKEVLVTGGFDQKLIVWHV